MKNKEGDAKKQQHTHRLKIDQNNKQQSSESEQNCSLKNVYNTR